MHKFNVVSTTMILTFFSVYNVYGFTVKPKQSFRLSEGSKTWFETATFYEIFPRSFKDSDNDGVGDLQGIVQKLDYFKDIGVTSIILYPIFKCDHGDGESVIDFQVVDPDLGTFDDFLTLIDTFHEQGIKVILDFIPNHTSDKHEWFTKSANGDAVYKDYYIWADSNGNDQVPNNWLSIYNNTAWEWSEIRQQYYLHQFASNQPDLNFHNSDVKIEFETIFKFWLDWGVDGIKINHVSYLVEDEALRDEIFSDDPAFKDGEYGYLSHVYTKDTAETLDVVYGWRTFFDEYNSASSPETKIIITEAYTYPQKTLLYFQNEDGSKHGAHIALNLDLISNLTLDSTASDLEQLLKMWHNILPSGFPKSWILGNADSHRLASRLGITDGYLMLAAFLQGATFTYSGDEIGQKDGLINCSEGRDPVAIMNCETYEFVTRDFQRTPFQWDSTVNAGFNQGANSWLPVSSEYTDINLENEKNKYRSSYKLYQNLTSGFHEIINTLYSKPNVTIEISSSDNLLSVFVGTKYECPDVELYALFFNLDMENSVLALFDMYDVVHYEVLLTSTLTTYQPGHLFTDGEAYLGDKQSLILKAECE